MRRKWLTLLLASALALSLWGCGEAAAGTVYVENVGAIVEKGSIAVNDKFPGVVVAEDRVEVKKDDTQTVTAVHVTVGQDVNAGDRLFSYDSEALSLELSKLRLELERLNNTVSTLKNQITQLQKEQKSASKEDQLSYTIEIQDRQAQLKEAEYNVSLKNREISQTDTALRNVHVVAPISGRVVSIDTEDTGELNGAYMILQPFGNYRIKGTINELNMGAIMAGALMNITARNSSGQVWTGVVSAEDLESNGQTGSQNPDSELTTSSSYTFYVDMDDSQGLMLGQHVYLELRGVASQKEGLWLPEYYLCNDSEGNIFVWAEDAQGLLGRRAVTLGGYDDASYTVEILEGLTAQDYIAFPGENCCTGARAIREDGTAPGDIPQAEASEESGTGPQGSSDLFADGEQGTTSPTEEIGSIGWQEGFGSLVNGTNGNSGSGNSGDQHSSGGSSGQSNASSNGDLQGEYPSSSGDLGG